MKHILVATDFSNDAYAALFYATNLLAAKSCTFYILNVYNEATPPKGKKFPLVGGKKLLEQLQTDSKEQLTETFHRIVLDNQNPKHRFETLSQKGIPSKVITKIAIEKEIDMVVMGNKGLTEAADIFFGSNTIQTVKKIDYCPVLTIPAESDFIEPKEIAFVTDYKKGCTKKTIAPLLFIASLFKASIRIVHINEEALLSKEQESHRTFLKMCLSNIDHSFHTLYEHSDKAKVIDTYLDKSGVDMFVMVNEKRGLFQNIFREPVIKDVSLYSKTPLLVIPCRD